MLPIIDWNARAATNLGRMDRFTDKTNCEYTVFRRSGGEYRMIKNLEEYHSAIFDLVDYKEDKTRVALNSYGNKFYIMRYLEDGTYWVMGYIYRGTI